MATAWDYFKSQIGAYDLTVYQTTLKKGGRERGEFTVNGIDPEDYYKLLLVVVDNIGSFLGPDAVRYNPYFCIVEMQFGDDVIEFDSSLMTYRFVSKEEEI